MSILRQGRVYVRNRFAGLIQETDSGYLFQYDPAYLQSAGNSAGTPEGSSAGESLTP